MMPNKPSNEDKRRLVDLKNDSTDREFSWVKQCLSILAIILGLIVSFKSGNASNMCEYIAFMSSVSFCGMSLLFGLIFLYSDHDTQYRLSLKYGQYIHSKGDYSNGDTEVSIAPRKIFSVLRVVFYVFLFLTILSLIALSAISSFPTLE